MVTRQLRLNTSEQMRNRLKEFTGREISIVLSNRTVLFGELKTISESELTFVNLRLHPVSLRLEAIAEVYVDFKE